MGRTSARPLRFNSERTYSGAMWQYGGCGTGDGAHATTRRSRAPRETETICLRSCTGDARRMARGAPTESTNHSFADATYRPRYRDAQRNRSSRKALYWPPVPVPSAGHVGQNIKDPPLRAPPYLLHFVESLARSKSISPPV